ncbi:pectin acetylesterase 8-like [Capsicum chacoense]
MLTTILATKELKVNMTILQSATAKGAVCLGSPPAYYLDRGYGSGIRSWIIYLDGGGWCDSVRSCKARSNGVLGSSTTTPLHPPATFSGILHNDPTVNPDFYNWNRVRVLYCDGSSFTGDAAHVDPETKVYYRGARIFKAIMDDLLQKGMPNAENAILSGTSAGGLATILNCDKFKSLLPKNAKVKCVADAGFFINAKTISGTSDIQKMYNKVVNLHGSAKNLPPSCTSAMKPSLCFFPQNVVPYVQTPLFIINSAYDTWQVGNTLALVRSSTFSELTPSSTRDYFITSCYSHGQIIWARYWFSPTSPQLLNKTIGEAVADWFSDKAVLQVF